MDSRDHATQRTTTSKPQISSTVADKTSNPPYPRGFHDEPRRSENESTVAGRVSSQPRSISDMVRALSIENADRPSVAGGPPSRSHVISPIDESSMYRPNLAVSRGRTSVEASTANPTVDREEDAGKSSSKGKPTQNKKISKK